MLTEAAAGCDGSAIHHDARLGGFVMTLQLYQAVRKRLANATTLLDVLGERMPSTISSAAVAAEGRPPPPPREDGGGTAVRGDNLLPPDARQQRQQRSVQVQTEPVEEVVRHSVAVQTPEGDGGSEPPAPAASHTKRTTLSPPAMRRPAAAEAEEEAAEEEEEDVVEDEVRRRRRVWLVGGTAPLPPDTLPLTEETEEDAGGDDPMHHARTGLPSTSFGGLDVIPVAGPSPAAALLRVWVPPGASPTAARGTSGVPLFPASPNDDHRTQAAATCQHHPLRGLPPGTCTHHHHPLRGRDQAPQPPGRSHGGGGGR